MSLHVFVVNVVFFYQRFVGLSQTLPGTRYVDENDVYAGTLWNAHRQLHVY